MTKVSTFLLTFMHQRFFYNKISKKSWSKRFFYTSKVLLQKFIEEILIKKVLLLIKCSFTENYPRNLDQKGSFNCQRFFYRKSYKKSLSKRFFYIKLLKKSCSKSFFYTSKVLLQKIIEEILIKKVLLHFKGSITENYWRNLDTKCSFTC